MLRDKITLTHIMSCFFLAFTTLYAPMAGSQTRDAVASGAPAEKERDQFREEMMKKPFPTKEGCFVAHYGITNWETVPCKAPPKIPNAPAQGPRPSYIGNGTGYFVQTTGSISSATGSFDNVNGASAETGTVQGGSQELPNVYSLQINTNTFNSSLCANGSNCSWQQFVFGQTTCTPGPIPCVFLQSWLIGHNSSCPSGWTYYPGTNGAPGCYFSSNATEVPRPSLADLGKLKLSGGTANGVDTATLSIANGDIYVARQNSPMQLANNWSKAEFNIFGDCCGSEAFFLNIGTSVTVRLGVNNGSASAPTCISSFSGATAETNNLSLVGSCTTVAGASPAIVFTESGGGPFPPAVSVGDPHLITFFGTHYDFQAGGDFLLVQADPNLVVQTRQRPINPNISVNSAIGVKIGDQSIAVCQVGADTLVEINGASTQLDSGKSISLPGGVVAARQNNIYTISGPTGEVIKAEIAGGFVNETLVLGTTNRDNIRGLLGGDRESRFLKLRDGTVLKPPISADQFRQFTEDWRVDTGDSIVCKRGFVPPSVPKKQVTSEDIDRTERENSRNICLRTGVKEGPLLEDCILDVSLLHDNSAADVFVHAPKPVVTVRPLP